MKSQTFDHAQADRIGVLLCNLGTPDAPTPSALRRYLREFLSDPRVVEFPRLLWWPILHGIILNIRPRRSARAYQKVWTEEGSPLAIHTAKQAELVGERLRHQYGDRVLVDWAMRYGKPAMHSGIANLLDQGARRVVVLPLYPQYSGATTGSTFDAIAADFTARRWLPELRFIGAYHDFPPYIAAIASSIRKHWAKAGRPQKLIFSYHGVPLRYLHSGDPYHCQCHKTSRLVADLLGLNSEDYLTTFQSRFGREEWLKPYTDHTLEALPSSGIKDVQVLCPGFSADCLETLEEIAMENREVFLEAGGESFAYIPALNSRPDHIEALATLIDNNLRDWMASPADDHDARKARYEAHTDNKP